MCEFFLLISGRVKRWLRGLRQPAGGVGGRQPVATHPGDGGVLVRGSAVPPARHLPLRHAAGLGAGAASTAGRKNGVHLAGAARRLPLSRAAVQEGPQPGRQVPDQAQPLTTSQKTTS
jgi:hypothetical protein